MMEVTSVTWERIQVVVHLRVGTPSGGLVAGSAVNPVWLAPSDGRRATRIAPSLVVPDGDGLLAHFNVMSGQEQMPLAPGRWVLGAEPVGSPPLRLASDMTFDPADASRAFAFEGGRYDVIAAVDPGTRVLSFRTDRVRVAAPARGFVARVRGTLRPTYRLVRSLPATACIAIARRTVRRTGRRILFTGGSAREAKGNLRLVHDRMVARGLDRDYDLVYSYGARRGKEDGSKVHMSMRDLWRMTRQVAAADIILVTGSLHAWAGRISPSPGTRYIQLWHAVGAFKTMGYSRVGKPRCLSPYARLHKDYTQVVVSSEPMRPFYAEAFGLPIERVVATGVPRTDPFFDPELRAASRERALAAFPMVAGRTTILFAPTFRGRAGRATYDDTQIDFRAFHALAVERDAVVIFKMHPFVRKPLPIPEALQDRLIDATRTPLEVNDLLFVVDLLISDYSSIIYEYATLGRPMLFFAYDLDEYIADRDVYEPYESFVPGRIVRTFPELLDAIRRDDCQLEKVAPFVVRNFAYVDGRSTDRVIDELILAR
jgi:CDP-glycerol glycerophosphotransferase (TagB/SpsB family)